MFRFALLWVAIVLCLFLHALQSGGVRMCAPPEKVNYSHAQDLVCGPANQIFTSLKPNHVEAISFGQSTSSWDKAYFAGYQIQSYGPDDNYYGLHATMDVYGHELKHGQLSSTTIWIIHDGDNTSSHNSIQVGWHIHPEYYGDSHTHFYSGWTRDGYATSGCINMDCSGFIHANSSVIAPGDAIHPVSIVPDGPVQNITLRLNKDKNTGDWWVYYGFNNIPTPVGYFPKSLFTNLAVKANRISFGAYVQSRQGLPTAPMGNGFLPNGGMGHAASFTDLQLIDQEGNSSPIPTALPKTVTDEKCHSITPIDHGMPLRWARRMHWIRSDNLL